MAILKVTPFAGMQPNTDKAMLPNNMAQIANNCRLTKGTLEPFKSPTSVYAPTGIGSTIKSIYRFEQNSTNEAQYWFTFTTDVDVVKGAVAGDTQERTYFTGDSYPKVTDITLAVSAAPYPTNAYHLGIPAPTAALNHTNTPISPVPSTPAETFVYTYTFVTPWGEESAPAPASAGIDVKVGDIVNITGMQTGVSGNYNLGTGATKRIYRSSVGSTSSSYLFVDEIPIAQTTYTDTKLTTQLGEVLPTLGASILPTSAVGLTNMANGIMAAFLEYDVYFCEAYKPYSWPTTYMQTVDFPIVGLKAFGTSLLVLTTGNPYVITGSDPSSMSVEKLAVPYSCSSKRSICSAFGDVIYAAPDGLISIGVSGTKVLTDKLMTRLEWQAYNPSSMMCAIWDDRIFIFYDNGTQGCLRLDDEQGLVTSDVYATAAYNDPVTGELYLCIGNDIKKWNAGTAMTYTWRSKVFTHPSFTNFAWGQVLANSYPVTLNLYASMNSTPVATKTVTSMSPFRLPSGSKAKYWEVELVGSVTVLSVTLAETLEELKDV